MNDKRPDSPPSGRIPGGIIGVLIVALLLTFFMNLMMQAIFSDTISRIPYSEFLDLVQAGYVERVEVQPDRLLISMQEGYIPFSLREQEEAYETAAEPIGILDRVLLEQQRRRTQTSPQETSRQYYTGLVENPELVALLQYHQVEFFAPVQNNNVILNIFLQWVLPLLFIYGMFLLVLRSLASRMGGRGGFMSFGQSNAKMYMEKKTGVTFEDVAGQEEAKESLTEIVDFLHNPEKYAEIGAILPKGALLVGPPGTGKTLLAKAVAGEANVVFFSLAGSDFVEMFVGVGASRVRDLFKQANQHAPCIIFIDEIDAIGRSRDSQVGSNDEREQTLNQLLSEMDGFDSSKGVVILGATNRPEILDKALLRPGRFDRRVYVELPDLKGREDVLRVHAKKIKTSKGVDLRKVALATAGVSGADLANMINESALRAVRMNRREVIQEDIMEAVEIVLIGAEKKNKIMSEKEKRIVAYHEVGHALAMSKVENKVPVQKITIVPHTKGALGFAWYVEEEERHLHTKSELLDRITVSLAGRAAETIIFDAESTGAADDIQKATGMARSMVSMYGMSEKFGMMSLENIENKYLTGRRVLTCSDQTGAEVDKEVMAILQTCYQRSLDLLQEHRKKMDDIAEFLLDRETITGEEFREILDRDY